jgi:hypothetical protein
MFGLIVCTVSKYELVLVYNHLGYRCISLLAVCVRCYRGKV